MRSLINIIWTILAAEGAAEAYESRRVARAFVPRFGRAGSMKHKQTRSLSGGLSHDSVPLLKLRGGAGPLEPSTVAQAASGLCLFTGVLFKLCPTPTLKMYKMDPSNEISQTMTSRLGAMYAAMGVAGYCLFSQGMDGIKAVALSEIVHIVEMTASSINGEPGKIGYNGNSNTMWSVINSFILYGGLKDEAWVGKLITGVGALLAATQAIMAINPVTGLKIYGLTDTDPKGKKSRFDKDSLTITKAFGAMSVAFGVLMVALTAGGMEPLKAFGYAWIPQMLYNLSGWFDDHNGLDKTLLAIWLMIHCLVIGTLLASVNKDTVIM